MLTGALLILAPLFIGFAIALESRRLMTLIHYSVESLVYFILALLGIGLGQMDDLWAQLGGMMSQVLLLTLGLLLFNMAGLWIWQCWQPLYLETPDSVGPTRYVRLFMAALKPLSAVLAGLMAGFYVLPSVPWVDRVATMALMALLFLIGLQLRNAGLSLRRLFMNRQGLGIAVTLALTSTLAGFALMPLLPLPWHDVLALTSGFGWYSLSGIVIGDALGPAWGGVAFLNDVIRELVALAVIPLLIERRPAMAIGYGGATAMDFTLPVIRSSGGLACVPVAIASGFILSFISPVLMGIFLAWSGA